ncbi:beta-lactamase-like protein [Phlebopus sp. FC_14]|nr:beta-lactamase-like protein [Phlebopus sp. FC_14]
MTENPSLPADRDNQTYVSVSAIAAGHFFLPYEEVFEGFSTAANQGAQMEGSVVPSFAFLLQHPSHGKLLFDLGLRKHGDGYPPTLKENLEVFSVDCSQDIVDQLRAGGTEPGDVKYVIYSHLHFDHVGDLTPFHHATVVMSADARERVESAYPHNTHSQVQAIPESQLIRYLHFSAEDLTDTVGMPPSTLVAPLGEFDRALDFFSDGSLYICDAPGHMPGHITALVRVAPNTFVLLAADSCHNRQCYDARSTNGGVIRIISPENYEDWAVAKETVLKVTRMSKRNVIVILAHEAEREEEMPMFPLTLNGWAGNR